VTDGFLEISWRAAKGINYGKRLLTISVFPGGENGDIGLENAYFWKLNVQ